MSRHTKTTLFSFNKQKNAIKDFHIFHLRMSDFIKLKASVSFSVVLSFKKGYGQRDGCFTTDEADLKLVTLWYKLQQAVG